MLKAVLIAISALLLFDAVAWGGSVRMEIVREVGIAVIEIGALSWKWG